ncbi:hypothetical protein BC833DRAFT_597428 [Globomyces pollinis-pini]|nr:hypothetical protein BC833DRAFT_597428 [Globomyces pollinis-pini]
MLVSKQRIISLYRQLIRQTKTLQYSDSEYVKNRITNEFRKNQLVKDNKELYETGIRFMNTRLGGIV